MTPGQRIAHERELLGWSQEDMAKAADCSRQMISEIERGKSERFSAQMLARIADALCVSMDYLYGRRDQSSYGQRWVVKKLREIADSMEGGQG